MQTLGGAAYMFLQSMETEKQGKMASSMHRGNMFTLFTEMMQEKVALMGIN